MNKIKIISGILLSLSIINGCSFTSLPSDARKSISGAESGIDSANKQLANTKPIVQNNFIQHKTTGYFGSKAIQISDSDNLPPVFQNQIQMDQTFYSLKDVADRVTNLTRIPTLVSYGQFASNGSEYFQPFRITQTDGNLLDLLSSITQKTDTAWSYQNNKIIISEYQTKRWKIRAIPGDIQVQNSIQNNAGIQGQGGASGGAQIGQGGGGGASTSQSQANQQASTIQNVAFNLQNSLWDMLKKSLEAMKSKNGKLNIDPSTSSVVMTDKPSVIELADGYIKKTNKDLNQEVIIDVQVLQVVTNKTDNYGINWNLALNGSNASFTINGQAVSAGSSGGTSFTPSPVFVPTNTTQAFTIGATSGDLSGSQLVINALSTIGKASLVTNSSHVTLNYQPAPFQFVNQQSYLASVSTTQTAQVGSQTALTPGQITLGYSLNVLPVVMDDNEVLVQVSLNLSSLNGIKVFSTQGAQIQLPDVQLGNALQKIKIRSGDTFVMSGFDSDTNKILNQGVGGATNWLLGGGVSADQTKQRLVVLITPHLV